MASEDARTWLDSLPSELTEQRTLLLALLDAVERDPRWRWLEVGCIEPVERRGRNPT